MKANINSEFLIGSIDDCCKYIKKPTVLVIDNAPAHRLKFFAEQLEKWQKEDLFIFLLPKYSPHLNKAEPPLARTLKYEWLKPTDYLSLAKYERKNKEYLTVSG